MSRQADALIESYTHTWTVVKGKCPHGHTIYEDHEKDDIPGFRCHDVFIRCDCKICDPREYLSAWSGTDGM